MLRRRNSDESLREIERAHLASPTDKSVIRRLLTELARSRGFDAALDHILALWIEHDLYPVEDDFDVIADVAFSVTTTSAELTRLIARIEQAALSAEERDHEASGLGPDEMTADQRAPWYRRMRFHDLPGFDRSRPWHGGRLYAPGHGRLLIVEKVLEPIGNGRMGTAGYLVADRATDPIVEGWRSVVVALAKGAWDIDCARGERPREDMTDLTQGLSEWALRSVLTEAKRAEAGPVGLLPCLVTTPKSKIVKTVVAKVTGARRKDVTLLNKNGNIERWSGRRGQVEVVRAAGPNMNEALKEILLRRYGVAEHPMRMRLRELTAKYHEERGTETLDLWWADKSRSAEREGNKEREVHVWHWTNDYEHETSEFEFGEPIIEQLEMDERPLIEQDWLEPAARWLHQMRIVAIEDFE